MGRYEFVDCLDLPDNPDPYTVYRILPKNFSREYYNERTDRNIGWITRDEQEVLRSSVVGVAGCGGMGAQLAEKFLRLGIGEIRIADSEAFDVSNINRQFAATRSTVGISKAFATARMLRSVSDDFTLVVYPGGICEATVEHFLDGCSVVCDEIEFWAVGARILLHRKARESKVPVFNCNTVGFGTRLFYFTHDRPAIEELLGFAYEEAKILQDKIQNKTASKDEIVKVMDAVLRVLVTEFPEYRAGDKEFIIKRLYESGKASIIASNPPMATGFLCDYILFYLLRDYGRNIAFPPESGYIYFDAGKLVAKTVGAVPAERDSITLRSARPEEMEEIYRLRYEIFCEELRFEDPQKYPDKRETDEYDARSHHIVVLRNDAIVGYTRLILPVENELFLMEHTVGLPDVFDRNKTAEVSRGLVVPQERRSCVKDILIGGVFDYCRKNNYKTLLSFSNKIMYESWKKRSTKFLYVGEPVSCRGFETWPLVISIK